jgi:hypothetical protein
MVTRSHGRCRHWRDTAARLVCALPSNLGTGAGSKASTTGPRRNAILFRFTWRREIGSRVE